MKGSKMTLSEFSDLANKARKIWVHAQGGNGAVAIGSKAAIDWAWLCVDTLGKHPSVRVDDHGGLWLAVAESTGERLTP